MGRPEPTHLVVGRIEKPHGIRGEVVVRSLTDHPGGIYSPGVVLLSNARSDEAPDLDAPPLRIQTVRPHKGGFLVHFGGMGNRSDVERLRGTLLFAAFDQLEPLDEGEHFFHQIVGLQAESSGGDALGRVVEVREVSTTLLLELRHAGRTVMVPWVPDFLVEVDVEAGRLVLDLPEGLIELND